MLGRIVSYLQHKHYGFLVVLDSSKREFFWHRSDIDVEPSVGMHVTFDLVEYAGRTKAANLKPISKPERVVSSPSEILGGKDEGGAR